MLMISISSKDDSFSFWFVSRGRTRTSTIRGTSSLASITLWSSHDVHREVEHRLRSSCSWWFRGSARMKPYFEQVFGTCYTSEQNEEQLYFSLSSQARWCRAAKTTIVKLVKEVPIDNVLSINKISRFLIFDIHNRNRNVEAKPIGSVSRNSVDLRHG